MRLSIKARLVALLLVPIVATGLAFVPVFSTQAGALSISDGANSAQTSDQSTCLWTSNDPANNCYQKAGVFNTITNVLLFIIGAVSVVMLIIGGIRYTISAGDSSAVTGAKNTILYAIVGIVVAILAYAVVNFVIGSFAPKSS